MTRRIPIVSDGKNGTSAFPHFQWAFSERSCTGLSLRITYCPIWCSTDSFQRSEHANIGMYMYPYTRSMAVNKMIWQVTQTRIDLLYIIGYILRSWKKIESSINFTSGTVRDSPVLLLEEFIIGFGVPTIDVERVQRTLLTRKVWATMLSVGSVLHCTYELHELPLIRASARH